MISEKTDSYDKLAEELGGQNDLATVLMMTLRNVHGADRLGVHVVSNIQTSLSAKGIGHEPAQLPNNQQAIVLIYRIGTPLDKLLKQLRDIRDDTDENIRKLIGNGRALQTIARIKELVCD